MRIFRIDKKTINESNIDQKSYKEYVGDYM